jgi:hypothetical protein
MILEEETVDNGAFLGGTGFLVVGEEWIRRMGELAGAGRGNHAKVGGRGSKSGGRSGVGEVVAAGEGAGGNGERGGGGGHGCVLE